MKIVREHRARAAEYDALMRDPAAIEIKAFVPARDFQLSKSFYQERGFTVAWSSEASRTFDTEPRAFCCRSFQAASTIMLHLLVQDMDAWWSHVLDQFIVAKYGTMIEPVSDKPWGMRDFAISDPGDVLWRIGQNINTRSHATPV